MEDTLDICSKKCYDIYRQIFEMFLYLLLYGNYLMKNKPQLFQSSVSHVYNGS